MRVDTAFTLKGISLVSCLSCFFHVLTLIQSLGSTQVSAANIVGEINPAQVEIGDDTNITCRMIRSYFNENNSSCLHFYERNSSIPIPKEHTNVVDEKSFPNVGDVSAQNTNNFCKCNDVLGSTQVITDIHLKRNITDFNCIVDDYVFMVCKFTVPPSNIKVNYKLNFNQRTINGDTNGLERKYIITFAKGYRQTIPDYHFKLIANTPHETWTQDFLIKQSSRIIPGKLNIKVENVSSNSAILRWNLKSFYENESAPHYEIRIKPENFEWIKIDNTLVKQNGQNCFIHLNNLKCSFLRYNYMVRMISKAAFEAGYNNTWSEASQGYFTTKARPPMRTPNINVGGFYIEPSHQNIYLYWEPLSECEKNGPKFMYGITHVEEDGKLIKPSIDMFEEKAILKLEWNSASRYKFELKSQNLIGSSVNSSFLEISAQKNKLTQTPIQIYHSQNRTYTVMWKQPKNIDNLKSYTLFSCVAKTGLGNQCLGKIHTEHLNKQAMSHTTSTNDNQTLNFALSENYHNYSTGMIWALCVLDTEPELKNINLVDPLISSTTIHLKWKTECWYGTVLKEYNLTYCKVHNKDSNECSEVNISVRISSTEKSYILTNLKKSTAYKMWIRMDSKDKNGPMKMFYVYETADDAAPNIVMITVVVLSLMTVVIVLVLFAISFTKKKIFLMRDIECTFPDGLEAIESKLNKCVDKPVTFYKSKLYSNEELSKCLPVTIKKIKVNGFMNANLSRNDMKVENGSPQLCCTQMELSNTDSSETSCMENEIAQPLNKKTFNRQITSLNSSDDPATIKLIQSSMPLSNPQLLNGYVSPKMFSKLSHHIKYFWFFMIAMCMVTTPALAHDYVGEVIPHHVELPIGGNVNITCRMNRSYFNNNNSSCLSFTKDLGNEMVPKENIYLVNDTSIVFMVRNASEQSVRYTCKCHDKGVYVSNIYVGTPPTNVTDFQCRGYDFSFMTCNFTVPENKIYTDYKLKFSTSSPDYIYPCTLENGLQPSERICNITMDKNNYRIVYQYYNFELTANNSLGTLTQSIMIDQYSRIVPARPNVEIGNITTSGVTLYWIVAKFSQYSHTDGLQYEIRLRPDKFDWFYVDTSTVLEKNDKDYKVEIKNLQYPFRRYDVIVRVKTVRADINDETMWSEPFVGSFFTKPRRPERAPNMDIGSFYIDPTEQNIRLYWQQLAEFEENGPDFLYNITEVRRDGKLLNVLPSQMDLTSATYEWQRFSHYQFKVQSQNQVGKSLNTSVLEVHPSRKRLQQIEQIQVITKVYHNQTYTITWRQPSDMNSLRNFTLFWCISKMESQSQCKGTINFKHFDKYTLNHTTEPQNHTLNFAVSANYDTYSTGMMWAMCTADGATDLTKMDPETTPISSNSIKVQWSTECLYMAILEGYNLTYCKVENGLSETVGSCIDTERNISISKSAKEYTITGLEPFTTYKISILMFSKLKVGPMSNPVTETTTEDAPSAPRKLKKYNVTSDSVTLSWLPPKHSNGHLKYYTVWYKQESIFINITSNDTESEVTFKLGSLSSYSDYKVYVTAHTVKSSVPSNDIHFKTLIGDPSNPQSITVNRDDHVMLLNWAPPKLPSGRVEFYEIRVSVKKHNESKVLKTSRVVGLLCKMNIPTCYDPTNSYVFDVRAVNVANNSEVDYHTFPKRDTSAYISVHQGAIKRRRHSNAEINTSVGASYQIHGTSEKHLRHLRHERENLKLISTTEPSILTHLSSELPYEFEDDSNEDFVCIGSEREVLKILSKYKDESQYKMFHSAWTEGPYFACSETKLSKITMLALAVIVVSMVLLAVAYSARKKYNKMSSIGLVIPEGLDDNIHEPKGVDNTIERDEIIRSDELFYDKENHRLLSKVGNDSGFLNSVQCLDKTSGYTCSDHHDSEKSSQSTDSVELNDITSCSYTSSPSHSPNVNIRESAIPEERLTTPVMTHSVQLRPSDNGYIKPMVMSNGYVQPQAFQKIQTKETPSFNGYTTLDAMGKPILPQTSSAAPISIPETNNEKEIATTQNAKGNICGYVTHKQLSDFGQRLH